MSHSRKPCTQTNEEAFRIAYAKKLARSKQPEVGDKVTFSYTPPGWPSPNGVIVGKSQGKSTC